jgi:hypothetical protein
MHWGKILELGSEECREYDAAAQIPCIVFAQID